jgi:hypothetical protein
MSFILMLTGLVPEIPSQMPILGFLSLLACGFAGVSILGSEDRKYDHQLELIRLEFYKAKVWSDQAEHDYKVHAEKLAELEGRVSKAISENRELAGRLR